MSTLLYAPPLSYYVGLFTSQYRTGTPQSIQANFAALMQPIADINACAALLNQDYELGTAIGVQLDVLGQILGQSRVMPFQPSMSVSPILDDDTYTKLLLAKVGINTWKGKIPLLYPLWQMIFPGGSIVFIDNQNMTATVILVGSFSSIESDLIINGLIVPRPETVLYNYEFASNLPFFGSDFDNSFIAGADIGHCT
jgi:uncharacterized protein DUF2612